jgi:hypothetical protein
MPFQTKLLQDVKVKPFPVFDFYEGFSSKSGFKSRVEFYFWQSLFNCVFYYLQILHWIDSITKLTLVFRLMDRIAERMTNWRGRHHGGDDFSLWHILIVLLVPPFPGLATLAAQVHASLIVSKSKDVTGVEFWGPLLRDGGKFGMILFWSAYYLTIDFDIFELDYVEAWNQQPQSQETRMVCLFFGKHSHIMHLGELRHSNTASGGQWDDAELIRVLRVHYGVFLGRKGLRRKFYPRELSHIAIVKVCHHGSRELNSRYQVLLH